MPILKMRKLYNSLVPVAQLDQDLLQKAEGNTELFVEIKTFSKSDLRKSAQNALYWGWLTDLQNTDVNEYAGTTKGEWHFFFKKEYLVHIYERDDPEGMGATLESLRNLYRNNGKTESTQIYDWIIKQQVSTTDAKIKQFTEYLLEIERYCHDAGIRLRTDSHIYATAIHNKTL